jgi:hypothetical protein
MTGRLIDHFLAAADTAIDVGGFAAHMAPWLKKAQVFDVANDVARAAGHLIYTRPSTLAGTFPLLRMPYETVWMEYMGGLGEYAQPRNDFDGAPIPWKQGVLIDSMPGGQRGLMTIGWMHNHREDHPEHAVNITPVAIYFDWRPDGDVGRTVQIAHDQIIASIGDPEVRGLVSTYREYLERKWLDWATADRVQAVFTGRRGWEKFGDDPREIEGIQIIDRHMKPGISPHGIGIIAFIMSFVKSKEEMKRFMLKWEADMQGEGGWVQCFLAMLNSKNPVVEHEPVDLTKLNKARRKSGKTEFLPYTKTRLALSRSQARIAHARGIDRETARQHLVRGHFKLRRSGVYWWSPFLRGDAQKGIVKREAYETQGGPKCP